ncbi:MAG: class I SAM-dependent methyltransferase [Candidatus Promineifilaceae bacterium]
MIVDLSKQRLNYDKIAHLYDEPMRDHDVDPNLTAYLAQQSDNTAVKRILDMGCGTGKQLTADYGAFPSLQLTGMDLFSGMLHIAQKRNSFVSWVQGDSANPPFASGSFDYITNQFSYQHVQHQEKMVAQIYRLLKQGGRFVMNNIDPWHMREWLIYQFFPAAWELDTKDFLPTEEFVRLMKTAGFIHIAVFRRNHLTEMTLDDVFAYVSKRERSSEFMAISDEDYAQGVRDVAQKIDALGADTTIQSAFCFLTIIGDKG